MANRRIASAEDPLVMIGFRAPKSLRDKLERYSKETGKPAASILRDMMLNMLDGHQAEKAELKAQIQERKMELSQLEARLSQLEESEADSKKLAEIREGLVQKHAAEMVKIMKAKYRPKLEDHRRFIEVRAETVNRKLGGQGATPGDYVTVDELTERILELAREKGVEVRV